MKVTLDEKERQTAWEYAEAAATNHMAFGRDPLNVIYDIWVGKMGEMAYCRLTGIPTTLVHMDPNVKVDPGYDFEIDGKKVDVKTAKTPLRRAYFNMNYTHCDEYAIVSYNPATNEFELVLTMSKQHALRNAKFEKKTWFWDLENDIEKLKSEI